MFTGLVECTGEIRSVNPRGDGSRLCVAAPFTAELTLGESVAVNGCCLTVTGVEAGAMHFDLLNETLKRTSLGGVAPGGLVNLERSLAAGARLGGHFVQGHVDGTAQIVDWSQRGEDWRLEVEMPTEGRGLFVEKGSIAVDGISLTVAELLPASFVCWIIPHTRGVTNLQQRVRGDRVNLEYDVLAKYVERLVALRLEGRGR